MHATRAFVHWMPAFAGHDSAGIALRSDLAPSPTDASGDTVQLYAAGSLKAALTDVAKAFEAKTGNKVEAKYGASGVLRKDEIADGAKADIVRLRQYGASASAQ